MHSRLHLLFLARLSLSLTPFMHLTALPRPCTLKLPDASYTARSPVLIEAHIGLINLYVSRAGSLTLWQCADGCTSSLIARTSMNPRQERVPHIAHLHGSPLTAPLPAPRTLRKISSELTLCMCGCAWLVHRRYHDKKSKLGIYIYICVCMRATQTLRARLAR